MDKKEYYTKECKGATIAIFPVKDGWDVYFTKPEYPLMFAFGLPLSPALKNVKDACAVAEANVGNYLDLFD